MSISTVGSNGSVVWVWSEGSLVRANNITRSLLQPAGLLITNASNIYVINSAIESGIDWWTWIGNIGGFMTDTNATCFSLVTDVKDNFYCSFSDHHKVIKRSLNSTMNTTTVVAGNGTPGFAPGMLNSPRGLYVTAKLELYVADCKNNRVQRFLPIRNNRTTVAGNGTLNTIALNCPTAITFDADGFLFIVDQNNHRVVGNGLAGFRCVAGCSGQSGSSSDQLYLPRSMAFDMNGNMLVADSGNNRIQEFVLASNACSKSAHIRTRIPMNLYLGISYNQPTFSICAKWNASAFMFADSSTSNFPSGAIHVDTNNTVYASISDLSSVYSWAEGSASSTLNVNGSVNQSQGFFITSSHDIYVGNGALNNRVVRWTPAGAISILIMNITANCSSLFVDLSNNMYCSISMEHRVIRSSFSMSSNIIVDAAGNGNAGSGPLMLNDPKGIFVSDHLDLYVADCANNRVQMFPFGEMTGDTVTENRASLSLNCPWGVVLDGEGQLFISDRNNHRIVRLFFGGFQCVFGCAGRYGSRFDQLNSPRGISFDSYGSLLVVDWGNRRIQKLVLTTNTCSKCLHRLLSCADTSSLPFYFLKYHWSSYHVRALIPQRWAPTVTLPRPYVINSAHVKTMALASIRTAVFKNITVHVYMASMVSSVKTIIGRVNRRHAGTMV